MNRVPCAIIAALLTSGPTSYAAQMLDASPHAPSGDPGHELIAEKRAPWTMVLARREVDLDAGITHVIDSFRPVQFFLGSTIR